MRIESVDNAMIVSFRVALYSFEWQQRFDSSAMARKFRDLPTELIEHIMSHLSPLQIIRFQQARLM